MTIGQAVKSTDRTVGDAVDDRPVGHHHLIPHGRLDLGMIPGGFVFVYAGSRLQNVHRIGDIFSTGMLSAFALLGLLMLIPVLYQKVIKRA